MKYDKLWAKYGQKKDQSIIEYKELTEEEDSIRCSLVILKHIDSIASQVKVDKAVLVELFNDLLDMQAEEQEGVSKLTWAFANLFLYRDLLTSHQYTETRASEAFLKVDPEKKHLHEAELVIVRESIPFYVKSSDDLFLKGDLAENTCIYTY